MRALLLIISLIAAAPSGAADPTTVDASSARPGDHPAIVARRVIAAQGYDYASKFYPHPAWLYLSAEAPGPMSDHSAVLVLRRAGHEPRATLEAAGRTVAEH
jgi:hypothetical protein